MVRGQDLANIGKQVRPLKTLFTSTFFNTPQLFIRVPAFENLKVKSAWAGYYDYNYHDQNALLGNHPKHPQVFFATGCSGHGKTFLLLIVLSHILLKVGFLFRTLGIQQAPAIGRATSELLLDAEYTNIDLRKFHHTRVINNEFYYERNIV